MCWIELAMSIQFTLVHGTSKACAQKIQSEGFLVSEMGFWGPAAYFYDRSENGIDLAKKWIDKKIKSKKI